MKNKINKIINNLKDNKIIAAQKSILEEPIDNRKKLLDQLFEIIDHTPELINKSSFLFFELNSFLKINQEEYARLFFIPFMAEFSYDLDQNLFHYIKAQFYKIKLTETKNFLIQNNYFDQILKGKKSDLYIIDQIMLLPSNLNKYQTIIDLTNMSLNYLKSQKNNIFLTKYDFDQLFFRPIIIFAIPILKICKLKDFLIQSKKEWKNSFIEQSIAEIVFSELRKKLSILREINFNLYKFNNFFSLLRLPQHYKFLIYEIEKFLLRELSSIDKDQISSFLKTTKDHYVTISFHKLAPICENVIFRIFLIAKNLSNNIEILINEKLIKEKEILKSIEESSELFKDLIKEKRVAYMTLIFPYDIYCFDRHFIEKMKHYKNNEIIKYH